MQLQQYDSQDQQIAAIIDYLAQASGQVLQTQDKCLIAVSGGRSPIALFTELSNSERFDFNKIEFTLVDERVVSAYSQDSNENLVRCYLLQNRALASQFVPLSIHTTQLPDIAILGMGEDGHTASIFGDCPELNRALDLHNQDIYMFTTPPYAPYKRITLTLAALTKIPHLILSINGAAKFNVLETVVDQFNRKQPISYVLKCRPDMIIFGCA